MPLTTSLFWVFVVCVLLLICAMASLVARRAWIIRQGVCFDLCVNVETEHSAKGWMLGFAVYGSSELLWYRAFSLMPRPKYRFARGTVLIDNRRDPEGVERVALHDGHVIVETTTATGVRQFALDPHDLTTLLSWLESSPPGRAVDNVG